MGSDSEEPATLIDDAHQNLDVYARFDRRSPISRLQQEFQQIVDSYYANLWSYVTMLTGGSAEGEDILHQAFLLAFDRLADGDQEIDDLGRWLRGVVRNLVRTWWRKKRKLPQDLADRLYDLAEEADTVPNRMIQAELGESLRNCLDQLAPAARRFVTARYEQGLAIREIADQEKVNESTARVRLFRIRQTLKACLESYPAGGMLS